MCFLYPSFKPYKIQIIYFNLLKKKVNTYYSPCDLSLLKAEDLPDVEEETDADEKLPDGSPVPIEGRKKTKSRKGKKKTGPRKRKILLSRMRQF